MKKVTFAMVTLALTALLPVATIAGETDVCKGCHNGSVAPTFETLKGKYKTADELVAAAKNSQNPMMKPMQSDEAKLKAAAAEIYK